MKQLKGIIPPLVTPFNKSEELDEAALRKQIRFMLDTGVDGVCVGGSTGQGYTLSLDELRRLVEVTADEVGGKVPIVAGIIANSTYDLIARAKAVREFNVAALQVTPTYYIFKPDDNSILGHFKAVTEAVDIPVIIYNVVRWNILSADLLVRIFLKVPGVLGVKQSGGEIKLLADLLIKAPKDKLIFTAQDALLYPSFMMGAHGSISANAAAVPSACLALWNAVKAGDHKMALELHKRLLRFWNTIAGDNMPACVKYALSLQGCPSGPPRQPMPDAKPEQRAAIKPALKDLLDYVSARAVKSGGRLAAKK
jgi:4-hydroxy-tetrahydrodipicolinate synthase